jgi:hypothetical protein
MKNKELQAILAKEDPEADVFMEFNGCTESGEWLDITNVDEDAIIILPDDDCIYRLSQHNIEEKEIVDKQKVICLYSNRQRYEPKF